MLNGQLPTARALLDAVRSAASGPAADADPPDAVSLCVHYLDRSWRDDGSEDAKRVRVACGVLFGMDQPLPYEMTDNEAEALLVRLRELVGARAATVRSS